MLENLHRKKNLLVIGLNSGTSADSLDLAAVKISTAGKKSRIEFISGKMTPYPRELHALVQKAIRQNLNSLEEVIILDRRLGDFYGREAALFLGRLKRRGLKADIIASHGQTVRHLPQKVKIGKGVFSGTLQLGHPESISARTGLPVVADFRQMDIALGGEGAPITTKAMGALFHDKKDSRLLINVGGIANYFLFPKNAEAKKALAADCGPGNTLLDIMAGRLFGQKMDSRGSLASQGKISMRLLSLLLADNFIKGRYGVSTGRERFGESFADKIMRQAKNLNLNRHDIMATVTELTAAAISRAVLPLLGKYRLDKIYVFGGGAKNRHLMNRLKSNLGDLPLFTVDSLGFNPDFLEATCYAVMGAWTIRGEASTLPQITGADQAAVAGRIILPPLKHA